MWERALDGGRYGESHEAGDVLDVSLLLMVLWCDGGMV